MKTSFAGLTVVLITFLIADSAYAKGWRGIVPLHSTRTDVERLLGSPTESMDTFSVRYKMKDESVEIRYSKGLPCGIGEKYSQWQVPENTVLSVFVTLLTPITPSQMGIDETKYKKKSGGHRPEDVYYISEKDGESVRVFQGEVQDINYYPSLADASVACPGVKIASEQECEGLAPARFKSYGLEQLQFEKLLLDNFALTLLDDKTRTGYIIVYAGKRARVGEANAWTQRIRKYLITVRHIAGEHLKVFDGGYRETAEVDLFIVNDGQCAPVPSPSVDPRDVEIISASTLQAPRRRLSIAVAVGGDEGVDQADDSALIFFGECE
jgi:hypothetical protein